MPWEYGALQEQSQPLDKCPLCGAQFQCFLRGMVHNTWRKLIRTEYCAVICQECKEIVGYEQPYTFSRKLFRGDHLQGM